MSCASSTEFSANDLKRSCQMNFVSAYLHRPFDPWLQVYRLPASPHRITGTILRLAPSSLRGDFRINIECWHNVSPVHYLNFSRMRTIETFSKNVGWFEPISSLKYNVIFRITNIIPLRFSSYHFVSRKISFAIIACQLVLVNTLRFTLIFAHLFDFF